MQPSPEHTRNAPSRDDPGEESLDELHQRREIWRRKYAIRACYARWIKWMEAQSAPGLTLEVGAGAGLVRELWSGKLYTTDIQQTPWIDFVSDATLMGIRDASVDNIMCIDALHHFADPHAYLREAARVVRPGGRLLMIEPWITPLSRLFYSLMHHEPICMTHYQDPELSAHDPWVGNLALANIVLGKEMPSWPERQPMWKPLLQKRFGMLDFQTAGGFKSWSLAPMPKLYDAFLAVDGLLDLTAPLTAFRILFVAERVSP